MSTVTNKPINGYLELVSYNLDSTDTYPYEIVFDTYVWSVAVLNNTANDVKVWVDRYARADEYILIPPGAYKEIATLTSYIKVDATVVGSEVVTVDVSRLVGISDLVTPVYPNLWSPAAENGTGTDIKLNPINLGGYFWTPWVTSTGEAAPSWKDAMLNVEYWLNGEFVSNVNSTNFYEELFQMINDYIVSLYPPGYEPAINPTYTPQQLDDVTRAISNYFASLDAPINDEFIGGWANMAVYDDGLARSEFILNAATDINSLQTPFPVLNYIVEALDGADVTFEVSTNGVLWTSHTVPANTTEVFNEYTQYWRVTSGAMKLTFSGAAVKMIEFAPMINIFYPIGIDDTSGLPVDAFQSWQDYLNAFKEKLAASQFTGRVIYWRALPFTSDPHPVYNADKVLGKLLEEKVNLVWEEVRRRAAVPYAWSNVENIMLDAIYNENFNYYLGLGRRPESLTEVVLDPNVTAYGETTQDGKLAILKDMLGRYYSGEVTTIVPIFWGLPAVK